MLVMQIEMIPLNKLVPSPANVRKTGASEGIDELAASIAAHGLLQNLRVRPGTNGTFEVVAGGRRLAALKRLAKHKTIPKDAPIPCDVREGAGVEVPRGGVVAADVRAPRVVAGCRRRARRERGGDQGGSEELSHGREGTAFRSALAPRR